MQRVSIPFAVLLIASFAAYALPFRQPNCNSGAHFALVQSLARGNKTIDRIHGESCDISWWRGHYYANKAPGLALATLPWYAAVRAAGLLRTDTSAAAPYPPAMRALPRSDLWLMTLWGAALPALVLLVVIRRAADLIEPGAGVAAAAVLGFATLALPFGSLFFSHVLATLLGFAAYLVVRGSARGHPARLVLGGVLAGSAVVVEYPLALLVVILGVLAALDEPRLRRLAAFAAGAVVGVAPLIAYGWWAFGTPFHLSYVGAVLVPGATGHDVLGANSVGFFGVTTPTLRHALDVLAGSRGLITIAPVLALAPVGIAILYRRGQRRDAVVLAAVAVVFFAYNASYYSPLGGATPGPRFLIPILPFLALALAPALRVLPLTALVLALISVTNLAVAHATQPLISPPYTTSHWWHWGRVGSFTEVVVDPGRHGWWPGILILIAVASGAAAGIVALRGVRLEDVGPAAIALVAWITEIAAFPHLGRSHVGAIAMAATVAVFVRAVRGAAVALVGALCAVAVIASAHHAAVAALFAAASLALSLWASRFLGLRQRRT